MQSTENATTASPLDSSISPERKKILAELVFAVGYESYDIVYLGKTSCDTLTDFLPPNTLYIQKISEHVVRCSVKKEYEDDFTHAFLTAEDFELSRLPNTQQLCDDPDISQRILEVTSKHNLTNTGFFGLDIGEIVNPKDRHFLGSVLFFLVSWALLSEFTFGGLQFYFGRDGLAKLLHWTILRWTKSAAAILWTSTVFSSIGSLLDLRVNLKSVSPANDALMALFMDNKLEVPWLQKWMTASLIASTLIAYPAGATGNILGVLPLMLPERDCPGVDTCMTARIGAGFLTTFVLIIGSAFYFIFGNSSRKAAFKTFGEYLKAPKADHNFWRNSQILIELISNIAFRATLLASTTVKTAAYYYPMSDADNQNLSILVTAGVTEDIMTSRAVRTIKHWSNPDFAYIKKDELANTTKKLSYSETYSVLETFVGIMMALGIFLFALNENIYYKILSPLFAVTTLVTNIMAQQSKASCYTALKSLRKEELIERKWNAKHQQITQEATIQTPFTGYAANDDDVLFTRALAKKTDMEKREERVTTAIKQYVALATALNIKLTTWDEVCIAGSLFIRGAVELASTDVISKVWLLNLDSTSLFGLLMFLIPPTLRNFGQMVAANMDEYAKQKTAEEYLLYRRELERNPSNTIEFQAWKKDNRATVFRSTYMNDLGFYTAKELDGALRLKAEELGHTFAKISNNA